MIVNGGWRARGWTRSVDVGGVGFGGGQQKSHEAFSGVQRLHGTALIGEMGFRVFPSKAACVHRPPRQLKKVKVKWAFDTLVRWWPTPRVVFYGQIEVKPEVPVGDNSTTYCSIKDVEQVILG
jgi:hypothetical protein